jgi:DNA repair protein RAD16
LAKTNPPATSTAFQRAKSLRNSEFSLNPLSNKRKRTISEDEEDEDSDNSPDAQLARAMQDEENSKISTLLDEIEEDIVPRRARRALRAIRPKVDYVSDFSEDEPDVKSSLRQKKAIVTAVQKTSKKTSARSSKKTRVAASESDESEFVISNSDDDASAILKSESSAEVPLASVSASKKLTPKSRMKEIIWNQSTSFRSRGSSSRAREVSRSRSRPSSSRPRFVAASTVKEEETESLTTKANADLDGFLSTLLSSADDDEEDLQSIAEKIFDWSSDTGAEEEYGSDGPNGHLPRHIRRAMQFRARHAGANIRRRAAQDRARLEKHHPELLTMWTDLESLPAIKKVKAAQPTNISRELKPFQLEGLSWMQAMEDTEWGGGLLGDEMGMGKTIQAVSLIMSDYPAKNPSLVLIPPVALMQWQQEIGDYTDGTLKTFVFHGTNRVTKDITAKELKKYDVILMSYNSMESMYRHQEKGFKRKNEVHFQKSVIHQLHFHRVILDEAHNIKVYISSVSPFTHKISVTAKSS